MKAAEEKFVKAYNAVAAARQPGDKFLNAFPEITLEENVNENQLDANALEQEPVRESIVVNEVVEQIDNAPVEPVKDDLSKSLQIDGAAK